MSNSAESNLKHFNLSDYVFNNSSTFSNDNIVYTDASTDESLSFNQLKILVRKINAGFQQVGLKKGDCVCISSPNNIYTPSIILGTVAAVSKTKYIIAHPNNMNTVLEAGKLAGIRKENIWSIIDDPNIPNWRKMLLYNDKQADSVPFSIEESKSTPAYICFSSGNTGPPKGAVLSHYNLITATKLMHILISSSPSANIRQKILGVVPLFHIFGIISFIFTSLYHGWEVVMLDHYNLETVCQVIEKYKVNSIRGAPPMLLHLLNNPSIVDKYDLSSLKIILVAAAPVPSLLYKRILEKFNIQVIQAYGMTETSGVLAMQISENYAPGSVGHMLDGIVAKVVDKDGKELKSGEPGEILIKSPIIMTKYLDNPTATCETIDTDGFLHTGDIGYVDSQGNWYIVDRTKELIKFNAYQIAPAELESILLSSPFVSDAAVIGIYDEKRETEVPRAYICLNPENTQIYNKSQLFKKFINLSTKMLFIIKDFVAV